MTIDVSTIGSEKIKNLHTGELGEISHVLKEHNIKLIGIGVEEENSEGFIQGKFFDGDLYCVEDLSTYKKLGFKRFNTVTILTSLFWKQSRKAMSKSSTMDLGGDLKGDWVQTGGALLVKEGGKDVHHFIQTGPADHMDNVDILKHFGLEDEYVPETMANQSRDDVQCSHLEQNDSEPCNREEYNYYFIEVLIFLSLVSGVMLEAPYAASGWRPDGPAFDPTRGQKNYPFDPRNPNNLNGVDVSVQGLPTAEQQIFQLSPINGQQYSGPSVNADVAKLNPQLQQAQYQQQLQIAREFERQRELEAAARQAKRPTYQAPGTFGQTTTAKPSRNPEETTEQFDLNEGETLDASRNQPEKVSVEITKQNIQEYPAELFLSPLTQLNQAQFVQLQQLGQLQNAPVIYQQVQAEPQGFGGPAHLAALPSVLAQRELFQQQQLSQNPIVVQQEAIAQPAPQYQLNQYQPIQPQIPAQPQIQPQYQPGQPQIQTVQYQPAQPQFQPGQPQFQPGQSQFQPGQPQIQTAFPVQPQFQPNPYQPTQPQFPVTPSGQYQPQIVFQPQSPKFQPANPDDVEEIETNQQQQPQFAYQFQQPNQQPQAYQPQFYQPNQQPIIAQPLDNQLIQFYQHQQQLESNQQGLQSGLDINQQGNDIEEKDRENDDTTTATAVATAFGIRTQPRVVAQYGVPSTAQRQPTPRYRTTTEAAQEEPATEDGPAIAEATAVANGSGRRNARLRSRRLRPVFTLDKSGHLVLAQNP